MSNNRITKLLHNRFCFEKQEPEGNLQGFTTNPFGSLVSTAQAQLYQAAFQRVQQELKRSEWRQAEIWN